MKDCARSISSLLFVLALALSFRPAAAQIAAPNGSFGFLINAAFNDTTDNNGAAILGVMNFDGAGNVSGTYTFQIGAPAGQTPQTLTGTFTGTNTANSDGTGSVSIALDMGVTFTFAMVMIDGGQGMQLVATGSSFTLGGGSFQLQGPPQSLTGQIPATLFAGPGATGNIPISMTATSQPGTTVFTPSSGIPTGTGTAQCNDGSTGTWTASVPAFTMVFNPDFPYYASNGGGPLTGDSVVAIFAQVCADPLNTKVSLAR